MDYQILWNEITTDPAGIGYSGLADDAAIANALNLPRAARRSVPVANMFNYLLTYGLISVLEDAAVNALHPGRDAARAVIQVRDHAALLPSIDLDNAASQAILGGLVATSLLTQAQADALVAMGATTKSRADVLGLGQVTSYEIGIARGRYGS